MIENKETQAIDNETLLRDYENTQKELFAYQLLVKANHILIDLPETDEIQRSMYLLEIMKRKNSIKHCEDFIKFLTDVIKGRSLEVPTIIMKVEQ